MAMPQGWETALLLILFWQGKNTVLAIVIFKHLINLEIYFTCLKSYNCQSLKPLWKFWVTLYKNPQCFNSDLPLLSNSSFPPHSSLLGDRLKNKQTSKKTFCLFIKTIYSLWLLLLKLGKFISVLSYVCIRDAFTFLICDPPKRKIKVNL